MKIITNIFLLIVSIFFIGCSSSTNNQSLISTTDKFKLEKINISVFQRHNPDIIYYTHEELKKLINEKIKVELNNQNLISDINTSDVLELDINYFRRFVGDETPFPSDSLGSPVINLTIKVKRKGKVIRTISEKGHLSLGFFSNWQVIGGVKRDKSYEMEYINGLSKLIIKNIKEL